MWKTFATASGPSRRRRCACELTRWQDPDCLDTLAAAYAESGDFQAAVKWQTQAIRLVRENVPSALLQAQNIAGRRGVGFENRLSFYKSNRPTANKFQWPARGIESGRRTNPGPGLMKSPSCKRFDFVAILLRGTGSLSLGRGLG